MNFALILAAVHIVHNPSTLLFPMPVTRPRRLIKSSPMWLTPLRVAQAVSGASVNSGAMTANSTPMTPDPQRCQSGAAGRIVDRWRDDLHGDGRKDRRRGDRDAHPGGIAAQSARFSASARTGPSTSRRRRCTWPPSREWMNNADLPLSFRKIYSTLLYN